MNPLHTLQRWSFGRHAERGDREREREGERERERERERIENKRRLYMDMFRNFVLHFVILLTFGRSYTFMLLSEKLFQLQT